MGIEACHQDARLRQRESLAQIVIEDVQGFGQRCRGDGRGHIRERQMRRHQCDTHATADKHHDDPSRARRFGQVFGMPRKRHAGLTDHALVHRRRHHAGKLSAHTPINGPIEHGQHAAAIARVEPARRHRHRTRGMQHLKRASWRRFGRLVGMQGDRHPQLAHALAQHLLIGQHHQPPWPVVINQAQTQFGPDARRLSAGHRQTGARHHDRSAYSTSSSRYCTKALLIN